MANNTDKLISSSFSLAIFIIATLAYFIARYYVVDRHINGSSTNRTVLGILYFLAVLGTQLSINIKNTTALCNGTPQTNTAILYTLIPNFFIFGTIIVLLGVLPGWKAPFSNTIGYAAVTWPSSIFGGEGVSEVFSDLVASKGSKLIDKICQDRSIIINEITPTNFFPFLERMGRDGILVNNWRQQQSAAVQSLWEFLAIKNLIAEVVWYLLTGILVITTTANSLLDITCESSSQQRNAAAAKFEQEQAKKVKPKAKYFTIHD
jgi:hypothetical protein